METKAVLAAKFVHTEEGVNIYLQIFPSTVANDPKIKKNINVFTHVELPDMDVAYRTQAFVVDIMSWTMDKAEKKETIF